MKNKVIIVEDDRLLNRALCKTFMNAGYEAAGAMSMQEAGNFLEDGTALMIVDIGLPDGDGFALCRQVQESTQIPVIFLTARDDEADMLRAFDCGADDYLVKPFPMAVLLKHAQAVLRRTGEKDAKLFCYEDLNIDFARKQVTSQGRSVNLTKKE